MQMIFVFAGVAFILSSLLILLTIKFCRHFSLYDPINARKIHSGNVPRLGGIAISVSFIVSMFLCLLLDKKLVFFDMVPLLLGVLVIIVFGILDDIYDIKAWQKLLAQLLATTFVVAGGFRITNIFGYSFYLTSFNRVLSSIITFCWVLGIINAYNLIDGLDGLCATLALSCVITSSFMYLPIFREGVALCVILSASILGFLVFNWPPAKIFMGDNGSQFLGFMVAIIPLYSKGSHTSTMEFNQFLILLNLVAVPMIDTIAAIWRRLRDRRPIMSPDKAHLHHKLMNIGFSKVQTLIMICAVQVILCFCVYLSTKTTQTIGTILLVCSYICVLCLFSLVHFANRYVVLKRKLLSKKPAINVINANSADK